MWLFGLRVSTAFIATKVATVLEIDVSNVGVFFCTMEVTSFRTLFTFGWLFFFSAISAILAIRAASYKDKASRSRKRCALPPSCFAPFLDGMHHSTIQRNDSLLGWRTNYDYVVSFEIEDILYSCWQYKFNFKSGGNNFERWVKVRFTDLIHCICLSLLSKFLLNRKTAKHYLPKSIQASISKGYNFYTVFSPQLPSKSRSLSNNGGNNEITYFYVSSRILRSLATEWFGTPRIYLVSIGSLIGFWLAIIMVVSEVASRFDCLPSVRTKWQRMISSILLSH